MNNQAKILVVLLVAATVVMAFMVSPALAGVPPITTGLPDSSQIDFPDSPQFDLGSIQLADPGAMIGDPPIEGTIGDPPYDGTIGDPPKEPPTVVNTGGSEGPCIDGFKEVTAYTEFSDGTAISAITLVPCDTCTFAEEYWMEDCNTCYIDSCGQVHCTMIYCAGTDYTPDPGAPGAGRGHPDGVCRSDSPVPAKDQVI